MIVRYAVSGGLTGLVLGLFSACAGPSHHAALPVPQATASATRAAESSAPPPAASRLTPEPLASAVAAPSPTPSCGMPASLVARGWRRELSPTSTEESPAFVAGSITLAVLPDTQYYVDCRSPHLEAQAAFIAQQAAERTIACAITLGDLTEHNTPAEWDFYRERVSSLAQRVPLLLVTGNHDEGEGGTANRRATLLGRYYPTAPGRASEVLTETERPGDLENAYYRLALPKVTLGVLALGWSPKRSTVAWANGVLTRHPTDRVIVATHAYLYQDGTRYDYAKKGAAQEWNPLSYATARVPDGDEADAAFDGEMLWNELVKRHRGVFLVLSGHVLGTGTSVLESRGEHKNLVEQVLVNYQMLREGGLGYLRLFEVLPDGKTLRMKSYSPSLGLFAREPDQVGDLTIDPPLWR